MGKRNLHGYTYYQCDWTGFPLKETNCFMPSWTSNDKVSKRGSYCNWESVLAHADFLFKQDKIKEDELKRIIDYVKEQMGGSINTSAPHFMDLEHFKCSIAPGEKQRSLSAQDYHNECCYEKDEIIGVKLNAAGQTFEVKIGTCNGKRDYKQHIQEPSRLTHNCKAVPELTCFKSYRKSKMKDKDICVFYYPTSEHDLELNSVASNLFKMQIYGDVLLLQCTKEASFIPRERYIGFSVSDFHENFSKKRKRQVQVTKPLEKEEYIQLKTEIESSLSEYEKRASSLSQLPTFQKTAKMPPFDGKQLADLKKHEMNLVEVPVEG